MAKYRVCFDGRWQKAFKDEDHALVWGREVAEETSRMVHVVRQGLLRPKLLAVFPESQAEEGERLWKIRAAGSDYGGGTWV
jgi:hypothetical protein